MLKSFKPFEYILSTYFKRNITVTPPKMKVCNNDFGPDDFSSVKQRYYKLKKEVDLKKNIKLFITKDFFSLKI